MNNEIDEFLDQLLASTGADALEEDERKVLKDDLSIRLLDRIAIAIYDELDEAHQVEADKLLNSDDFGFEDFVAYARKNGVDADEVAARTTLQFRILYTGGSQAAKLEEYMDDMSEKEKNREYGKILAEIRSDEKRARDQAIDEEVEQEVAESTKNVAANAIVENDVEHVDISAEKTPEETEGGDASSEAPVDDGLTYVHGINRGGGEA